MSESVTDAVAAHLRAAVGTEPQRASVTFLGLEPMDVLRFATDDGVVFASVGCSRHPMTDPTGFDVDPLRGPRAEVVVRMRSAGDLAGLHRSLAVLAAAPAVEGMVLVPDALVDLSEPLWTGSSCTAVVLQADVVEQCPLPAPMSPVEFLRAVPITANEAAWVRLRGVDELRRAWTEAGVDIADPHRVAVDPGA
ncbi:suppressor of fused domain protein [Williamsia deligens]|uniref:Suppressor of fused domain protein n=1 Tax=Williamsia deligens TaxID=321325 RepID=A0ABW3GF39_9NOCA|nr:suppressor of fused domain protein [Williamsia deligens]MCP2196230.1 Suppressor of fused protein (SUFU) [Williamsia deligens]